MAQEGEITVCPLLEVAQVTAAVTGVEGRIRGVKEVERVGVLGRADAVAGVGGAEETQGVDLRGEGVGKGEVGVVRLLQLREEVEEEKRTEESLVGEAGGEGGGWGRDRGRRRGGGGGR